MNLPAPLLVTLAALALHLTACDVEDVTGCDGPVDPAGDLCRYFDDAEEPVTATAEADPAATPFVSWAAKVTLPPGGVGWVRLYSRSYGWQAIGVQPPVPLRFHEESAGPGGLETTGTPLELSCGGAAVELETRAGGWLRLGPTAETEVTVGHWVDSPCE